jgi:hypothetical protein
LFAWLVCHLGFKLCFDLAQFFQGLFNEAYPLRIGEKGTFEAIQDHLFQGGIIPAKFLDSQHIFIRDAGVADGSVIGIYCHPDALFQIEINGMAFGLSHRFGVGVTLDADLLWDAVIIHII